MWISVTRMAEITEYEYGHTNQSSQFYIIARITGPFFLLLRPAPFYRFCYSPSVRIILRYCVNKVPQMVFNGLNATFVATPVDVGWSQQTRAHLQILVWD